MNPFANMILASHSQLQRELIESMFRPINCFHMCTFLAFRYKLAEAVNETTLKVKVKFWLLLFTASKSLIK